MSFTCKSLGMEECTGTSPFPSVGKNANSYCQPGMLRWHTRTKFLTPESILALLDIIWAFSENSQPSLKMLLQCCQKELFLKNSNVIFALLNVWY